MNQLAQARVDFGFHNVQASILKNVYQALLDLGLPTGAAIDRLQAHVYEGTTFIAGLRISGRQLLDMYDSHPGVAYFPIDCSTFASLPAMTIEQAKKHLSKDVIESFWWAEVQPDEFCQHEPGSWITTLDLLDNLGNVVAVGAYREGFVDWQEPKLVDIPSVLSKVTELRAGASYESSWDNFETARGLMQRASHLLKQVSISQHAKRVAA